MARMFKGTPTEYVALHNWVRKHLGKPERCEVCIVGVEGAIFEWANISGEYRKELDDWARLCRWCHHQFDGLFQRRAYCKNGHKMSPDNVVKKIRRSRLTGGMNF